jgi:hypothetical protein
MNTSQNIVLSAIGICLSIAASAQNFVPDAKGHIADPAFLKLMKQHGYQLITAFDTASIKPFKLIAKAIKNGQMVTINTRGDEVNTQDYTPVRLSPSGGLGDVTIDEPLEDKKELFEQTNAGGKVGTRNKTTKKIGLPVIYDEIVWLGNGLLSIKQGDKKGLAKTDGTVLLKPTYQSISIFNNTVKGRAVFYSVWDNNKFGLLNNHFIEVIPLNFDYIMSCYGCDVSGNLVVVSRERKKGLMTLTGKELLPTAYEDIKPLWLTPMPIAIKQDKKMGLVDSTGHILIPPTFTDIKYQQEDKTIQLTLNYRYGAADLHGKIIAEPVYQNIYPFKGGLAVVEKDGKYGVISKLGAVVVEPDYNFLYIAGKYIVAEKDGVRGLLDTKGKILLPFQYQSLAYDDNGIFFQKDGIFGMMTVAGKLLAKFNYEDVKYASGYLIVKKDNKYGVLNTSGEVLIPIKYDKFTNTSFFLNDGTTSVLLDGRKGFVDLYGNEVFR